MENILMYAAVVLTSIIVGMAVLIWTKSATPERKKILAGAVINAVALLGLVYLVKRSKNR
jgi:nitrogen fixation/metabolism regulation signal transduction histidine kinase